MIVLANDRHQRVIEVVPELPSKRNTSKAPLLEAYELIPNFSTSDLSDLLTHLKTDMTTGLSTVQAEERRRYYGLNDVTLSDKKPHKRVTVNWGSLSILMGALKTAWDRVSDGIIAKYLEQFKNPLILLLLSSAGVSLLLGQIENCTSIVLAILLVVTVAFIQEYRTEKSLEALNKLAPPKCRVFRDGALNELLAAELVPGDLVELHAGDRVPADIRLTNVLQT